MKDGYDKPQPLIIKSAPQRWVKSLPLPSFVKILYVITLWKSDKFCQTIALLFLSTIGTQTILAAFRRFFVVPGKYRGMDCLSLGRSNFITSNLIFNSYHNILCYIDWATDSVAK
jgi:hypothetical protein